MTASPTASGPGLAAIYEKSLDCVHCGLCLPTCPTYRETGRESSSPRGRIYLMRAIAEGRMPLAEAAAEEMYLCLGCRACETACPSGVQYGALLELARAEIERADLRRGLAKRVESFVLRGVVPHARRLRLAMDALGVVQRLGLDRMVARLGQVFGRDRLADLVLRAPRVPARRERAPLCAFTPAEGERRGRVAFFVGCVMPELFGAVNHATVRVLARNGFDVVVPEGQGCCGALHAHAGDLAFAHDLARRNLAAFRAGEFDALVVNSAGCGAVLREIGHWLPGEGDAIGAKVRDVSEVLVEAGIRAPAHGRPLRVCYDDPCHLVHGQRVADAPRRLLEAIPGTKLVSHDDPTSCCGAAGIYNLTHPAMSDAVLERKLRSLAAVDPDVIASGNPGCILQLRQGAARRGMRARVAHPIELLDEAYL